MLFDKYRILYNSGYYYIQERGLFWLWKEPDRAEYYSDIVDVISFIGIRTNHKQRSITLIPFEEVFHC